jgi:hypothetical protein
MSRAVSGPRRRGCDTRDVCRDVVADLLWTMHKTRDQPEVTYPENLFNN